MAELSKHFNKTIFCLHRSRVSYHFYKNWWTTNDLSALPVPASLPPCCALSLLRASLFQRWHIGAIIRVSLCYLLSPFSQLVSVFMDSAGYSNSDIFACSRRLSPGVNVLSEVHRGWADGRYLCEQIRERGSLCLCMQVCLCTCSKLLLVCVCVLLM